MTPPPDSEVEAALRAQLLAATTAAERGRLHAELAVCAGRALAYRRMNFHEDASAQAYAERSAPLQRAYAAYRAAIDAFNHRRDDEGLALLREARPVIVAELGAAHPYAQQVTNTLAGRLRGTGTDTLAERLELCEWIVEAKRAVYGREHTSTCQHLADLAYVLAGAGKSAEAMLAFEEAIDGLAKGPARTSPAAPRPVPRAVRRRGHAGAQQSARTSAVRPRASRPSLGASDLLPPSPRRRAGL
jgi:hypothetical protein